MGGVCKIHILMRVAPPSTANIEVRMTVLGLNKCMAAPVRQAQPITPEIMLDMVTFLDLSKREDVVFWSVVVIGFLTFFRKSNLIPDAKDTFDAAKQLSRAAVTFDDTLAILSITWTKNNTV